MAHIRWAGLGCTLACLTGGGVQAATGGALINGAVSDSSRTTLSYSMPQGLAASGDQGALASGHQLNHLQLVMKRSADQQAALDALVAAQTTPGSATYHQWLTPVQLRNYGPSAADIATTEAWLQSHGLVVNKVSPTGMSIDFSGTAANVGAAFNTSLHSYTVQGAQHFSESSEQSIPSALSPVVSGAVLSNFFPHPMVSASRKPSAAVLAGGVVHKVGSSYTMTVQGTTYYAVTPSDFHTIYDENGILNGSSFLGKVTGKGVTVAVAEQTDINPADVQNFRSQFGLSGYQGTVTITHPGNCGDPGFTAADETEAAIDVEWSGAVAPDASIIEASCPADETGFGVETALQNLVEGGTKASAISVSYGGSEVENGIVFNTQWANLVEEGAAEGISIFVSSGDGAADIADTGATVGTSGVNVNGLASNIYDTAVGGTDFIDTAEGENGKFWNTSNSSTGGSAKSYVPEIPWDNSCGSTVNWQAAKAAGPLQNCNNPQTSAAYQNVVGGSGGQSLLFAKPSWQLTSVPGVPKDGVRDLPDISLFAANGFWNHFYLECMSNTANGGVPCDYSNPTDFLGSAYGGTSFAAPDFAGIAALVVEYGGKVGKVGNMAPVLYQIAKVQYTNSLLVKQCQATNFPANPLCVFHDVTVGDNSVACQAGTPNCYSNASSTKGIGISSTARRSCRSPSRRRWATTWRPAWARSIFRSS